MRSTTRARLAMCRGDFSGAASMHKVMRAQFDAMKVADVLMRSAGFQSPDEDAAPSMAVTPPKPRPLPPSTAPRPVSLTRLPDGRAILDVGDARIDFSEREIEVLTWMLSPKVPKAPVSDWRT